MDRSFEEMVKNIIEREGGSKLTRDPDDPGGTTKYGISQRAHKDVDIENLTYDQAVDIYNEQYYKPSKANSFPPELQEIYLDMVVNLGQRNAVKVLQKACNSKGSKMIAVDGRIGPQTTKAANNLELERLKSYRVLYYASLVDSNPTQEKFWFGWYLRAIA